MKLAHALNDSLVGLIIPGEVEGGVLLAQLDEGICHLLIVALGGRLNRNLDDRVWELHGSTQAGFLGHKV